MLISSRVQRFRLVAMMIATGAGCGGEWFATGPYEDPCRDGLVAPAALDFVLLEGGIGHFCGIDAQGGAWCWGANGQNQITPGDDRIITEPRQVRIEF